MAQFVYEGPGHGLSIAGRNLTRGIPASLEGRAAEAAANHPDVSAYEPGAAASGPGGGDYVELQARAKALGLPAIGTKASLAKAIAAEEKRLADEAAAAGSGGGAD